MSTPLQNALFNVKAVAIKAFNDTLNVGEYETQSSEAATYLEQTRIYLQRFPPDGPAVRAAKAAAEAATLAADTAKAIAAAANPATKAAAEASASTAVTLKRHLDDVVYGILADQTGAIISAAERKAKNAFYMARDAKGDAPVRKAQFWEALALLAKAESAAKADLSSLKANESIRHSLDLSAAAAWLKNPVETAKAALADRKASLDDMKYCRHGILRCWCSCRFRVASATEEAAALETVFGSPSASSNNVSIAMSLGVSPSDLLITATHWTEDPVLVAANRAKEVAEGIRLNSLGQIHICCDCCTTATATTAQ